MTATAKKLLSAALKLSAGERHELVESLLGAPPEEASQAEVDSAWALELDRRLKAIRSGAPQGDDWAVVEKRLRRRIRR